MKTKIKGQTEYQQNVYYITNINKLQTIYC